MLGECKHWPIMTISNKALFYVTMHYLTQFQSHIWTLQRVRLVILLQMDRGTDGQMHTWKDDNTYHCWWWSKRKNLLHQYINNLLFWLPSRLTHPWLCCCQPIAKMTCLLLHAKMMPNLGTGYHCLQPTSHHVAHVSCHCSVPSCGVMIEQTDNILLAPHSSIVSIFACHEKNNKFTKYV